MVFGGGFGGMPYGGIGFQKVQEPVDEHGRPKSHPDFGRPERPEFESTRKEDGTMQDQYQVQNNLNTGYLDSMRQDALRDPGQNSTWRDLQQQKLDRQAGGMNQSIANKQAQMQDQMAMRGGLGAGASERMANQGVQQSLAAQQSVFGQGLQLDIADETNRLNNLQGLGNAEMQAAQFGQNTDKFNIQNALQDVTQERLADNNQYSEQMQAWAAKKTAEATPSSKGGKK